MNWILLLTLAVVVFFNRYFFLEPNVSFELPKFVQQMLSYSAPCLLTAICTPIIFFNGDQLRSLPLDPYLITAILCIIFAVLFKKILVNLLLSLCAFYLLSCFLH
ncbi:MAG: AzlD domain-containing protein [Candidatus Acinetobacter avistercoris]|uniref:AzlD domain-containing protein n=1 Tax=Acinetobacter sp. KS-LM10 TaxID=3120518 RepID=UPI001F87FD01|nr:AzlD domain-containing protein [Candidatus Acinetobacter avistercoris]